MEKVDLKGRKFGSLVAVEKVGKDRFGHAIWRCVCEKCGGERELNYVSLMSGKVRDCGCGVRGVDLTGETIGSIMPYKVVGLDGNKRNIWLCKCRMCGKRFTMSSRRLLRGDRPAPRCPICGA